METTAAIRLPQLLNECMQQLPNLPLELQTHPTGYLLNAVQQGEVDCAFVASKYVIPELYSFPVWQEQLVWFAQNNKLIFPTTPSQRLDLLHFDKDVPIGMQLSCLNDHSVPPSQIMGKWAVWMAL